MALVNVALPGATEITQMDEADLHKLEGSYENDNEVCRWVQYHLKTTGDLVHRSVHMDLKNVPAELVQALFA
jgi:hypothetical protein